MGRWSEFSACIVCQVVRLYSVVEIVVMSGDGLGYVYVCESYVVPDQCNEPPSLFVPYVCAYGGVVGYLMCFSFLCEFCFLYCDEVRLGAVY